VSQRANWLFGGVYGTLLCSGLLATAYDQGSAQPFTDALWITMTMATTMVARAYAQHVSTHTADAGAFWRPFGNKILDGWPLFTACLPSVFVLLVSGITHWGENWYTLAGMGLNVGLLFVWGMTAARTGGYRWLSTVLVGCGHATLGVVIAVISFLVK
jgi:hypothetical protein